MEGFASVTTTESRISPTESDPDPQQNSVIAVTVVDVQGPRVRWGEDVVDNEGLERKTSKVCCIYRKKGNRSDSESEDEADQLNAYEKCPHK